MQGGSGQKEEEGLTVGGCGVMEGKWTTGTLTHWTKRGRNPHGHRRLVSPGRLKSGPYLVNLHGVFIAALCPYLGYAHALAGRWLILSQGRPKKARIRENARRWDTGAGQFLERVTEYYIRVWRNKTRIPDVDRSKPGNGNMIYSQ
ncbi:hypothetical protein EVAR_22069_1 [Eumeta japonica]|uniref:Uncharacterized protein n=1 Tax=Eumeta variegata TaxID=151549 RepID=A0A4C1UTV0_EUMVA|nr:hypothetical protein EVAR_22069_1 [Eumeta japonica]